MERNRIARVLMRMAKDVDSATENEKQQMASELIRLARRLVAEADAEEEDDDVTEASYRRWAEDDDEEEDDDVTEASRRYFAEEDDDEDDDDDVMEASEDEDDEDDDVTEASYRRRRARAAAAAKKKDEDDEEIDPAMQAKIVLLRKGLPQLARKKNRRLKQFGIERILPNKTVEDLIDAVLRLI